MYTHHLGILTRNAAYYNQNDLDFYEQYKEKISLLCPNLKIDIMRLEAQGTFTEAEIEQLVNFDILILSEGKLLNYIGPLPHLPKLKWVSTFYAGVDNLLKTFEGKDRPNFIVSRNMGYFDQQMAEYVIGMVLMKERNFYQLKQNQLNKIWAGKHNYRSLSELKFGIVGFGSIGKTIAQNLLPFKTSVIAYVRNLTSSTNHLPNVQLTTDLKYLLSSCDYVCSVLPKTTQTNGFFDGDLLKTCSRKKSIFINIGRGNVVKEETLIHALNETWISHAILDVFETEPLPTSSQLWHNPNITLTPHISGIALNYTQLAENFSKDYKLFKEGKTLNNLVDFEKGY